MCVHCTVQIETIFGVFTVHNAELRWLLLCLQCIVRLTGDRTVQNETLFGVFTVYISE